MQHNKIYQVKVPMKDCDITLDPSVLAPDKSKALEKSKESLDPEHCNFDKITVKEHSKYKKIKELFKDYNILNVINKEAEEVKLKVENNRRKKGYDIFIIFFTGANYNKIKSVLRVKDLSRKYGYLCNGQPSKNMEHYKL